MPSRRQFLAQTAAASAVMASGIWTRLQAQDGQKKKEERTPLFKISLAEWSFHKALMGGTMDHLDFAKTAKEFQIEGVEYVNQFFMDKAKDEKYLAELKKRAEDLGIRSVLIMCDNEGKIGDPDEKGRTKAVENHYKWVDAAKYLGCHSIRVNAASDGSYEDQLKLAADGLRRLSEYAAKQDMNVIVENHGGLSSNGQWLSSVMKTVNLPNCGTLPDFGNFHEYDRYKGTTELMPFAKGVSAKSHDFDEKGNETETDYFKMMKIVLDAGYHGFVGIEYEGDKIEEHEGVRLTKALLERVREHLSKA